MFSEQDKLLLNTYNAALSLYKQRKWDQAISGFEKALEIRPNDGPSKLYLERSLTYKKTPPNDDWDGVSVMTTK